MKSNGLRCSGIGLIEVLITTVVIALGLLAVARFQVGVIGESRDNKAMVEARNYCASGIEDLRSAITKSRTVGGEKVFWAASEDSPIEDTHAGKSATYVRTMVVENLPLPDDAAPEDKDVREKRVTATCSWDGGEVELQTILTLHAANRSALASGVGVGGGPAISPSLNAGASDDIGEVLPLQPTDEGYGNAGQVIEIDNELYVVQANGESAAKSERCAGLKPAPPLPFENGLRARRTDNDGLPGMEAIELFEVVSDAGGALCVPRVRFNGGVIIPIRGVVHSRASDNKTLLGLELFTLNVSESGAYCVFNPQEGATSAPYTCYVGGNCGHGPLGTDDEDMTQCPTTAVPSVLTKVGEGGWRGRVGLLNVADKGLNVCFLEEATSQSFGGRDSARSYFSYNVGPDSAATSDDRSQGINKPYSCHDFLIVDGKPNDRQLHQECVAQARTVGGLKLASKTTSRNISTGSYANVYDPVVNIDSCSDIQGTEYTITGALIHPFGPLVQASDGVSTWDCSVDGEAYSCTFTTARSAVEIFALQGGVRYPDQDSPCIVELDPLGTGCAIAFPESNQDSSYVISGFIAGSAAATELSPDGGLLNLEVQYGGEASACTVGSHNGSGRTYTCPFVAPEGVTEATIVAQAASLYSVGAYSPSVALPGGATAPVEVVGPDFTVSAVGNLKIRGNIRISGEGLKGNETVTPSLNPEGSLDCSNLTLPALNRSVSSVSYECTVRAGSQTVSYSISPGCLKDGKSEYKLSMAASSGTVVSSAIGSLTVNLGSVSTDQTINVTLARTELACE
jgi:Tfp pilus assembly protein PilV